MVGGREFFLVGSANLHGDLLHCQFREYKVIQSFYDQWRWSEWTSFSIHQRLNTIFIGWVGIRCHFVKETLKHQERKEIITLDWSEGSRNKNGISLKRWRKSFFTYFKSDWVFKGLKTPKNRSPDPFLDPKEW